MRSLTNLVGRRQPTYQLTNCLHRGRMVRVSVDVAVAA